MLAQTALEFSPDSPVSLREQERTLAAAAAASAPAFVVVWSNPEDDLYDAL
jgi:hypothetical protein